MKKKNIKIDITLYNKIKEIQLKEITKQDKFISLSKVLEEKLNLKEDGSN
jgi:hypothetical protein